jgi:predicted metal-dependent enzyme (double-stranded beta helix superfamily)
MNDYSVSDFVQDLRAAAAQAPGETALLERVKPLVLALAGARGWVAPHHYECDEQQGFGVHVLHEGPDHGPWVVAVAWLPHRGAPPHDHGTWVVVAGVDGEESNSHWRRRDGTIEREREEVVGPGQVIAFLPRAIHSVTNNSDRITLSLHVYGKNVNFTERSQFDPATGAEQPFKIRASSSTVR